MHLASNVLLPHRWHLRRLWVYLATVAVGVWRAAAAAARQVYYLTQAAWQELPGRALNRQKSVPRSRRCGERRRRRRRTPHLPKVLGRFFYCFPPLESRFEVLASIRVINFLPFRFKNF